MVIHPSRDNFIEDAKKGNIYPVYTELPFVSPQQIYELIKCPYSFLLESIKGPEKIARYSFIGTEPFLIFTVKDGIAEIKFEGQESENPPLPPFVKGGMGGFSGNPLKRLKELLTAYKIESLPNLPPFIGGAMGLLSYDFVHYLERLPRTVIDDLQIPDAHFLFFDTVLAFDHKQKKTYIISCPGANEIVNSRVQGFKDSSNSKWGEYYDRAFERISRLYEKVDARYKIQDTKELISFKSRIEIHHEMSKENYMNIVKRTKEYIKAGDIFQANLSQRVSANIGNTEQWEIYKTLSMINPSPFAAYLDMGDYQIASSSPERLLLFTGGTVETRPIAGTRPRGMDARGDKEMREDLLLNEKERAEHLMLIDLERNDLGKISDYGSVFVDEFMITEDYSHVIHIVSNIKGRAAKNKTCFDAIGAAFPGGTITGVPKVRCMEIIDELELAARGPYTGSLGYISFAGAMDLNIIIRTFVVKNGVAYVQAGAGIVADSEPEKEYFETLKKAEALIKTLEML